MSFPCLKCGQEFTTSTGLKNHLKGKRLIPCDFICDCCGEPQGNDSRYRRHKKKECSPKQYSKEEIQQKITSVHINSNNNSNNATAIGSNNLIVGNNSHVHNNVFHPVFKVGLENVTMTYIQDHGIVPHGLEGEGLLEHNFLALNALFADYLECHADGKYSDESLHQMLINVIQMLYTNAKTPQYINIIDDEPHNNHNKVYSGKEFIEDKIPKNDRNGRVTISIIKLLNSFMKIKNVAPGVIKFVNDVFIPQILNSIYTGVFHLTFQEAWRINNLHVKKMKQFKGLPPNAKMLSDNDIMGQYNEYTQNYHDLVHGYAKYLCDKIDDRLSSARDSNKKPTINNICQILGQDGEEVNLAVEPSVQEPAAQPIVEEPVDEETQRIESKKLEMIETIKKSAGMLKEAARDV